MKQVFNKVFLFEDNNHIYGGQALDGNGKLIKTLNIISRLNIQAIGRKKDQSPVMI